LRERKRTQRNPKTEEKILKTKIKNPKQRKQKKGQRIFIQGLEKRWEIQSIVISSTTISMDADTLLKNADSDMRPLLIVHSEPVVEIWTIGVSFSILNHIFYPRAQNQTITLYSPTQEVREERERIFQRGGDNPTQEVREERERIFQRGWVNQEETDTKKSEKEEEGETWTKK
jgi:hypothetical protein